MTPEKLAELAHLQHGERFDLLNPSGVARLESLRTELSLEQQEKADDPKTWFTDESRRPQLNGIDWNDANHQMCRGEVFALIAKYGLPLVELALAGLKG